MSQEPKRHEGSPLKNPKGGGQSTPFEGIRRTNPAGIEFWSSRDFAKVLGYADYRNFQSVIKSARTACFNSGLRVADHFVEVTDMIAVGKGAKRPAKTVMMSRYACYLAIQNADPAKGSKQPDHPRACKRAQDQLSAGRMMDSERLLFPKSPPPRRRKGIGTPY